MSSVLIRNGWVIDGSGTAAFQADVLIQDQFIRAIQPGLTPAPETQVLDAKNLVLTPGFIDIHRHCDTGPLQDNAPFPDYGDVLLRQGITTTVTGNCGISLYPLSPNAQVRSEMQSYYAPVLGPITAYQQITSYQDYMAALAERSLPVNTMAMIGTGAVRIAVNGFSEEPLTPEQVEQGRGMVEAAMQQGAPGASIGLMYLPECYASVQELGRILEPLGKYDRILCTHIRGEGDSLVRSIAEVIEIARLAGCRLEISHFKSCGLKNWGKGIYEAIDLIEAARHKGQKVYCDFYPYDCGSTTLLSLIPPAFVAGDLARALQQMQTRSGQQQLRDMLAREYADWDNYVISLGWDKAEISAVERPENQWMIGKNITEIAREGSFADEVEAAASLLVAENGNVAIVIHSMDSRDVDAVAKLPDSLVISDAIYAETKRPHPRMYGAFPHVIHDFVAERRVLSLETAVKKMTSLPAQRMRLDKRGSLKVGYYADINVFDPSRFQDHATYAEPTELPAGLSWTLINGRIVLKNDQIQNKQAGQLLKLPPSERF